MYLIQQFNRFFGPAAPVTEQSAFDADSFVTETVWSKQINGDIIIVSGVQGYIAPGFGDGTHHIQRAVAVEWSDLDCQNIIYFGKFPPEFIGQYPAADTGLEIEADDRDDVGNFGAVFQHGVDGFTGEGAQAEQTGIVTAGSFKLRFIKSLFGFAANAADFEDIFSGTLAPFVNESGSLFEYRFKESDLFFADLELGAPASI